MAHPAAHTVARASRRGRQTRADVAPPRLESNVRIDDELMAKMASTPKAKRAKRARDKKAKEEAEEEEFMMEDF